MRVLPVVFAVLLTSGLVLAGEHSVNSDAKTDFAALKTFAFRQMKCGSDFPELNNALYTRQLSDTIRTALLEKGLKEAASNADIVIDFRFDGMDTSEPGKPGRTPSEAVQGRRVAQGALTIDLFARATNMLVWEGIYRERQDTAAGLARKYPADAKSLLALYPPKKK